MFSKNIIKIIAFSIISRNTFAYNHLKYDLFSERKSGSKTHSQTTFQHYAYRSLSDSVDLGAYSLSTKFHIAANNIFAHNHKALSGELNIHKTIFEQHQFDLHADFTSGTNNLLMPFVSKSFASDQSAKHYYARYGWPIYYKQSRLTHGIELGYQDNTLFDTTTTGTNINATLHTSVEDFYAMYYINYAKPLAKGWMVSQDFSAGGTIKSTTSSQAEGSLSRNDVDSNAGYLLFSSTARVTKTINDHFFINTKLFYNYIKWNEKMVLSGIKDITYSELGVGIALGYSF